MAFIHTIAILSMLFLMMTAWIIEVIKTYTGHTAEDDVFCMLKPQISKLPTALLLTERAACSSAPVHTQSPFPPLNPGATPSHPPLPPVSDDAAVSGAPPDDCPVPSQTQSRDPDVSVAFVFHFDYDFSSQAASHVDPTPASGEESQNHLLASDDVKVVVSPKVSTAPIIILSPPSPKKKKWGTKKKQRSTKLSTSPSAPVPLQTLTPNHYRVFPSRAPKSIPHPTPAQANPTISKENSENRSSDNRVLPEVVLRPTVSTAPVISITPPSPQKKQGTKTEKSNKVSTSSSGSVPLQTLRPDYYRVFAHRARKTTPTPANKENVGPPPVGPPPAAPLPVAPPPVVSMRKASRRSREEQLREYIPPWYLLAQRCIDIVHSRSADHAAADVILYGAPQKF